MSYNLGTDYGYDQINVDSNDFRDFLATTDANRLHNINKINERENRLIQKINRYKPTCAENRGRNSIDYCPPGLYSKAGSNIEQNRMEMRKHIEDYYFAGKEYRIGDCQSPPQKSPQFKPAQERLRNSVKNYLEADRERVNSTHANSTRANSTREGFSGGEGFDSNDLRYLHDELENMDKKNNMLMLFVFFLVIVVMVQYSKINNNSQPMKLMILPAGVENGKVSIVESPEK